MSYTLRQMFNQSRLVLKARLENKHSQVKKAQVEEILNRVDNSNTKPSEQAFQRLLTSYSGVPEYGYDSRSIMLRAMARTKQLLEAVPVLDRDSTALEVACGDGMTGVLLTVFGMSVKLTDLTDWRNVRARDLPFFACDLGSEENLAEGPYDLIYSYNAFEHFPNPRSVLTRMIMALRPGGHLFFEFGPLYCGPWGLHAYRMLPMPYPQFLFSEAFWREKLSSQKVSDLGQELDDIQPLNKWKVSEFDALWGEFGLEVLRNEKYKSNEFINLVLEFPQAFQGRGLTIDDLTTQGICVLLRKPT